MRGLGCFCGFGEFYGAGVRFYGVKVVFVEQGGFYGVGVRRVVDNGRIFQPEPATR